MLLMLKVAVASMLRLENALETANLAESRCSLGHQKEMKEEL